MHILALTLYFLVASIPDTDNRQGQTLISLTSLMIKAISAIEIRGSIKIAMKFR